MKVAILYICTGGYDVFWKDFYLSFEKNFLSKSEKHYFVFTDVQHLFDEENNSRIHKIYQVAYSWPYSSLKRYEMFMPHLNILADYDYIFFMNANIICNYPISEEEFLPRKLYLHDETLTVVLFPGHYNQKRRHLPYERNPKSNAYVPYTAGKYYISGGVNGGTASAFCTLIEQLHFQIEEDLKHNIIARCHDESYTNKYIVDRDDYRLLSPSYFYPEDWKIPFESKLLVLDKSKWIPVDKIKGINNTLPAQRLRSARRRLQYVYDDITCIKEKYLGI